MRAFARGIEAISACNAWTQARREAAWNEAVRLAMLCRIYGGDFQTAVMALDAARANGCAGALRYAEARWALAAWTPIAGKIPGLAWLARRGYGQIPDDTKENVA